MLAQDAHSNDVQGIVVIALAILSADDIAHRDEELRSDK
jgi:hypothetical protein